LRISKTIAYPIAFNENLKRFSAGDIINVLHPAQIGRRPRTKDTLGAWLIIYNYRLAERFRHILCGHAPPEI